MTTPADPRGRVLKITHQPTGHSQVVIDNGVVSTITIHCQAETLHHLLAADLPAIREHLVTRKPGHFRKKSKKG